MLALITEHRVVDTVEHDDLLFDRLERRENGVGIVHGEGRVRTLRTPKWILRAVRIGKDGQAQRTGALPERRILEQSKARQHGGGGANGFEKRSSRPSVHGVTVRLVKTLLVA